MTTVKKQTASLPRLGMRFAQLERVYCFQSAHRLPNTPPGHKCHNLHGHTYHARFFARGAVGDETGWVCDFALLDDAWAQIKPRLDHRDLNLLLENPTSENLTHWLLMTAHNLCPSIWAVEVAENPYSNVRVELTADRGGQWRGKVSDKWEPAYLEAGTATTEGGAKP